MRSNVWIAGGPGICANRTKEAERTAHERDAFLSADLIKRGGDMISSTMNDLTRFETSRIVGIVELPPKDPYDDDDENKEDDEDDDNGEEDDEPAVIREPDES